MRVLFDRFWKAVLIGVANVIPGVSGGTMAVITGLYEELVASVGALTQPRKWLSQLPVLGPVLAGAAVGVVAFAKLVLWLLSFMPEPTGLLFAALVAAGFPLLWKLFHEQKPGVPGWIALAAGFLAVASLAFIVPPSKDSLAVMTQRDTITLVLIFLAGLAAAGSMVIPGISGSFILLMMGLYTTVLGAVTSLELLVIIPFGLGAVLGLFLAARGMDFLFRKYPQVAYGSVFGLVAGSLIPLVQKALEAPARVVTAANLGGWVLAADAAAVIIGLLLGTLLGKRPQSKNSP